MATAADAAQSRDEAEQSAEAVYAAAVAFVAAQLAGEGEEEADADLLLAATLFALLLIRSIPRRYGSDVDLGRIDVDPEETAGDYGPGIATTAKRHASDHYETVKRRADPAASQAETVQAFRDDTAWVKAAARSTATQQAAETAIDLLPLVDADTGKKHDLLWVSRGDHRVRKTHRRLHGNIRAFGKPFKTFPTGQTLRFPGDPLAPIEEIANCRCGLLLVPSADARSAKDLFKVSDDDWDAIDGLAATAVGLAASVGWGQDDMDQAVADWINEHS